MRLFLNLLVVCVVGLFSGSVFGQKPTTTPVKPATTPVKPATTPTTAVKTPAVGSRIGLIFPGAFEDPTAGIKKYVAGLSSVEALFRKELDDIKALLARIQNLEKELVALKQQLDAQPNPNVPINRAQIQTTFTTKAEEYDKLGREYKFKQEDLKARFQKKQQEVMGPILLDIGKAMQEFGKQKGFSMILDGGKLQELGALLGVGDETVDATREFVAFYNAKTTTPVTK